MFKRTFSVVIILMLLISMLMMTFNIQPVKALGTIHIRADGSIDPPSAPITTMDNVTYTLTSDIVSDSGGIAIERNNMTLDGAGYTVQGSWQGLGINASGRTGVTVMNVRVKTFYIGIALWGSSNSTLVENNVTENQDTGIDVYSSSNCTIRGNRVEDDRLGIDLYLSSNCSLRENSMINQWNLLVSGYSLQHYIHNIDSSNTVDGKPVYYLMNQHNLTVSPSNYPNVGCLALVNSTDITVEGLTLTHNGAAVLLAYCRNSTVRNATVSASIEGISVKGSQNCSVYYNNANGNEAGLSLSSSSGILAYGNSVTHCNTGIIVVEGANCSISNNNASLSDYGMYLQPADNCSISNNQIVGSDYGIYLSYSSNNTIVENTITSNGVKGVVLHYSSNNALYHNNFVSNTVQASVTAGYVNAWDCGYPSGGNYWSDYIGADDYSGPYQNETGCDGIGDTNYTIGSNDLDRFPLIHAFGPICNLNTSRAYLSIQSAINANETLDGHVIYAKSGLYYEHVVVNKSVSLLGENSLTTIIDGSGTGNVVYISANNVRIEGFTVRKGDYGIYLLSSTNDSITRNNITSNNWGMLLHSSSNNSISENSIVSNSYDGIWMHNSSSNIVNGNNVTANVRYGIGLGTLAISNLLSRNNVVENGDTGICLWESSSNNTVDVNNLTTNGYYGILLYSSCNNTLFGNSLSKSEYHGVYMIYGSDYNNVAGNNITSNNGAGIVLDSSSNNTITMNKLANNTQDGILLSYSNNTIVGQNDVEASGYGIILFFSPSNVIIRNNVTSNGVRGIWLYSSSNNTISENNAASNNDYGILLEQNSDNNNICENVIADNLLYGLKVYYSNGNAVGGNRVTNNSLGIVLESSSNNVVSGNNASSHGWGIYLYSSAGNNAVHCNNATNNTYGITIYSSDNIIWRNNVSSNYCGVFLGNLTHNRMYENVITDDVYGLMLYSASNNTIFHNTFADDTFDTLVDSLSLDNLWDNGYPSGGNYWSIYVGADLFSGSSQNGTGSDGIGDTPHTIDANNTDQYPLMKPYAGPHDIAITDLNKSKTVLGFDFNMNMSIHIINYGLQPETFNVTVYANSTITGEAIMIETFLNVTLPARNSTTLTFIFNTDWLGFSKGNYSLMAVADAVLGEADTLDNNFTDGWFIIAMKGDLTGGTGNPWDFVPDSIVDGSDLIVVSRCFGSSPTTQPPMKWHPNCDITNDGVIDGSDLIIVSRNFGQQDP